LSGELLQISLNFSCNNSPLNETGVATLHYPQSNFLFVC